MPSSELVRYRHHPYRRFQRVTPFQAAGGLGVNALYSAGRWAFDRYRAITKSPASKMYKGGWKKGRRPTTNPRGMVPSSTKTLRRVVTQCSGTGTPPTPASALTNVSRSQLFFYSNGMGGNGTSLALPTSANSFLMMTNIPRGLNNQERLGTKINLSSLIIQGSICHTLTTGSQFVRMIVVYDAFPQGDLPLLNDIYLSVGTGASKADVAYTNIDYRRRFTILRDMSWSLGPAGSGQECRAVNEYISIGLPTVFRNGLDLGTYSDVQNGAVYVLCFGDQLSTSPDAATFEGTCRLAFRDAVP